MTYNQSTRLHITNTERSMWQITDPKTEQPVLYLTDPGIHIEGQAGQYLSAGFQILPSLDVTVDAQLQYVCQSCWMPLEQVIQRSVRITSEREPALFSNLTFTDVESGELLLFVAAVEMSLVSSLEHGPQTHALLTCIELASTRLNTHVHSNVCQQCERTLKEPHHKNCSCPPCRKRKLQEQEELLTHFEEEK